MKDENCGEKAPSKEVREEMLTSIIKVQEEIKKEKEKNEKHDS